MIKGRVSVIIPARNERYLQATIDGLLANADGDVEIIPILDGVMSTGEFQPLNADPRVSPIFKREPEGMRPAINDGGQKATGEFLMKCDGHILIGEHWDTILKADCDEDWLVVPTRHSLDAASWTPRLRYFNYSILTYPYLSSMYGSGFHAVTFPWNQNPAINAQRAHLPIDDILSAQGSLWFQHRDYFLRFPPLDHERFYFYQESQEVMGRILASGGRCVVNKQTFYCHLHKGKETQGADGRPGRGFFLDIRKKRSSEALMTEVLKTNVWPYAVPVTRTFESLIEQHWWLIAQMTDPRYAWPADWRDFETYKQRFENRRPDEIPAHT